MIEDYSALINYMYRLKKIVDDVMVFMEKNGQKDLSSFHRVVASCKKAINRINANTDLHNLSLTPEQAALLIKWRGWLAKMGTMFVDYYIECLNEHDLVPLEEHADYLTRLNKLLCVVCDLDDGQKKQLRNAEQQKYRSLRVGGVSLDAVFNPAKEFAIFSELLASDALSYLVQCYLPLAEKAAGKLGADLLEDKRGLFQTIINILSKRYFRGSDEPLAILQAETMCLLKWQSFHAGKELSDENAVILTTQLYAIADMLRSDSELPISMLTAMGNALDLFQRECSKSEKKDAEGETAMLAEIEIAKNLIMRLADEIEGMKSKRNGLSK